MCVGLPAKVVRIKDGMALVDASGAKREVSAELLDELDPGDYVMVHAGVDPEVTNIEDSDPELLAWIREYFYMNPCNPEYTYIFGHTPLCYVNDDHSFNIWYDPDYHNKIGIDGGLAVADRGQLNCLCLTDGSSYKIPYKDGQPGELQRIIKDLK